DSMVDQSSVMCVRASTTERLTDSPSTMRAESPVVPPYEPPRLQRTWYPYRYASCRGAVKLNMSKCHRVTDVSARSIRPHHKTNSPAVDGLNPAVCGER